MRVWPKETRFPSRRLPAYLADDTDRWVGVLSGEEALFVSQGLIIAQFTSVPIRIRTTLFWEAIPKGKEKTFLSLTAEFRFQLKKKKV